MQSVTGFTGLPNGLTINGVSASGSGTNAGNYNVTFTIGNVLIMDGAEDVTEQYAVTYVPGSLTINKAPATIAVIGLSKVYGEPDPTPFIASVTGTVNSETLDYTLSRAPGENVGVYAISAALGSGTVNDNYNTTIINGVLAITGKTVTIDIDDQSKTYGDADPTLIATVSGLEFGDTLGLLLSRAPGEDVGTYAITAKYASNLNYMVTVNDATLTINPKPITLTVDDKTKTSGNNDPAFTATVAGLIGTDSLAYTLSRTTGEGIGNYAITATYTADANYTVTVINGTLTILRAAVTPDADCYTGSYAYADNCDHRES